MTKIKTRLDKTNDNITYLYGQALRDSGFGNIIRNWADLLALLADDDNIETFSRFMSNQAFTDQFVPSFWPARKLEVEYAGWWDDKLDRKTLRKDPQWDDTIKGYYEDVFRKAIGTK